MPVLSLTTTITITIIIQTAQHKLQTLAHSPPWLSKSLGDMLSSLEMTVINGLAGIGFLLAVFGILLAFVSLLWIAARVGNAERMNMLV